MGTGGKSQLVERGCVEAVGLIGGSQPGLAAEAKDGFSEETVELGTGVYFLGLVLHFSLRGQEAEEGGLSSGGGA